MSSEYFGAKVDWISDEKKVIIVYGDDQIEVRLNSKEAKINDKVITLGMLPSIHSDRAYVDSDFISEAFGIRTGYLPATYKATDNSLAYDAVVWVDSTAHAYNEVIAKTILRDMLKDKLLSGLENYIRLNEGGRFAKEVADVST